MSDNLYPRPDQVYGSGTKRGWQAGVPGGTFFKDELKKLEKSQNRHKIEIDDVDQLIETELLKKDNENASK